MFQNKVVVITGAGSGIGRELAIQMVEAGAHVALSDINQVGLDKTMKLLPDASKAKGYLLDVSSWTPSRPMPTR